MSAQRARKLVEAGVWLRISGDHDGARRLFEQALRLDPSNVRAKQLLDAPPSGPLPPQATGSHTPPEGTAAVRNPFVRGEGPSRSVGLDVDWGLAAILPESQAPLRGPSQADPAEPPVSWEAKPQWMAEPSSGQAVGSAAPSAHTPASSRPIRDDLSPLQARDNEVKSLVQAAQDLIGLEDYSGAMELILKALHLAPERADLRQLGERTEAKLLSMLETKLGGSRAIARVLLKQDEVVWLNLDHRAGFVLSQIDGSLTLDDLFAVSGMSRLDTARILVQLKEQGAIALA
jgi:tetratricopeptide (TPR) repeat protein